MAKATWKILRYLRDGAGHAGRLIKTKATRQKMREAALRRYQNPNERKRTKEAVKEAFQDIDRSGPNNPHFGRHHSDEAKRKISTKVAERGGHRGSRNPNFKHGDYVEE